MSQPLSDFIYDFLVRYYLFDNDYSLVVTNSNEIEAFLLANSINDRNDSLQFYKENVTKLDDYDKEVALKYFDYLDKNTQIINHYIKNDSLCIGLIASNIKGLGRKLINELKSIAKTNNIKEIYLWADETCNTTFYKKLGFDVIYEYYSNLIDEKIKSFIFRIDI